MLNILTNLKNGQIRRNLKKYFLPRQMKKIDKKCEKW